MGRVKEMSPQGLRKLGIIIKKEKALIDETAAAIFLQLYLDKN